MEKGSRKEEDTKNALSIGVGPVMAAVAPWAGSAQARPISRRRESTDGYARRPWLGPATA
jgi:hypothetical protein